LTLFKKYQKAVMLLLILAMTAAVFSPVLFHDFINYDDKDYITQNPTIVSGWTTEGVVWAFTSRLHGHWHPLTWLSHMTDYQLFGANPMGHHLTSLLLHLAGTGVLFLLLFRMTGAVYKSAFVAALFAIHPLHVETVAWTADRKDVLCAFFFLSGLWLYLRYTEKPGIFRYLAIVLCFVLALMAKSMAVTLPLVLLILDFWPLNRFESKPDNASKASGFGRMRRLMNTPLATRITEKGVLFILLITGAGAAIGAMRHELPSLKMLIKILPSQVHLSNAMVSYVSYMGKMIWPVNLSIVYPYFTRIPLPYIASAGTLLVVLTILFFRKRRPYPYLWAGWLWYMVTLLPAVGIIKSGPHAPADRYTYLPLIGLFIMIAWGVPELFSKVKKKNAVLFSAGVATILLFAVISSIQLGHWKNSETVFRHAIGVNPYNWIAHNNLGNTLARQGDIDQAVIQYKTALSIKPDNAKALNNMGAVLIRKGKADEAVDFLEKAVKLKSRFPEARYNLGDALARQGEYARAAKHLKKALKYRPDDTATCLTLGVVYERMGERGRALKFFNRVLEKNTGHYGALHNKGVVLAGLGRMDEAVSSLNKALKVKPTSEDTRLFLAETLFYMKEKTAAAGHYETLLKLHPGHLQAHMKLGDISMMEGNLINAQKHYAAAVDIKPDVAGTHNNLGVTLARMGKMEEAVRHFSKAVELDPDFPGAKKNLNRAMRLVGKPPYSP
jgi:protein O-mannosyl-transferase